MPTLDQQALMQRLNLSAHGVAVTVTPPAGASVSTTGIWHAPQAEAQPFGTDFRRRDPRRVMELPRTSTLEDVPRGSIVHAADRDGGLVKTWRADGLERQDDPLRYYVILVPA